MDGNLCECGGENRSGLGGFWADWDGSVWVKGPCCEVVETGGDNWAWAVLIEGEWDRTVVWLENFGEWELGFKWSGGVGTLLGVNGGGLRVSWLRL